MNNICELWEGTFRCICLSCYFVSKLIADRTLYESSEGKQTAFYHLIVSLSYEGLLVILLAKLRSTTDLSLLNILSVSAVESFLSIIIKSSPQFILTLRCTCNALKYTFFSFFFFFLWVEKRLADEFWPFVYSIEPTFWKSIGRVIFQSWTSVTILCFYQINVLYSVYLNIALTYSTTELY